MAMFKDDNHLWKSTCDVFEDEHPPGTVAPWTGIYACQECNHEIASNEGDLLPPAHHHRHPAPEAIRWKLIVYADQRAKQAAARPGEAGPGALTGTAGRRGSAATPGRPASRCA